MRSRSKKMNRAMPLAVALLAMLLVTACGGFGQASDFSATTLEGDEFSLEEKRGEVVALYFMAAY
jgi:major membrane immunogen (membrane-anchored lipoprotein)